MALISPRIVEQQYGIPADRLRRWRQQGIGPEYFQFTPRTISYSAEYLHDWINDPANAPLTGAATGDTGPCRPEKATTES
ncbi:helix-turn-helix transcriptional regulator [Arthrobacter sp. NPDC058097]|uniref:helix-turn-helix transcriptional regulator n=1 Tax=Arthrobacter sp. NPDC058097 TaxID=3346340 RepID=UPI0036DD28CB